MRLEKYSKLRNDYSIHSMINMSRIKFQERLSNFLPSHGPSCSTDLLDYFRITAECGVGVF